MIKRNVMKLFGMLFGLALLLCPASAIPAQAANIPSPASAAERESIEPRQPVIEWVIKEIDGKIYRRLYNYSTGEWIGDWIPCN